MQTCRTCQHMKSDKHMSPQGFSLCAKGPSWKFWPLRHTCGAWQPAEAKQMEKREAWLAKRGM